MTPREIVAELDKHIVGQDAAKRAVAIALRNRWRWQKLSDDVRKEVTPKNILMIGPTGVGKTEITRRLANLMGAPFVKVEASRYTEVGYYGRDVESIIRDLVEAANNLVRNKKRAEVETHAVERVEDRLLDLLVPSTEWQGDSPEREAAGQRRERTKEKLREKLRAGDLEDQTVEITVEQRTAPVQIFSNMGMEQMDMDLQGMLEKIMPRQSSKRQLKVREARRVLLDQEIEALVDKDAVHEEALRLAERSGVVFLDEIDKVCGPEEGGRGPDVSRQGVQRDLLPIVEGTTVQTRYGSIKTDHILFIAAGAFHKSKPSDLMPELQGRFPIRVELKDLTRDDFVRILTEPATSLTRQYELLLATDGVKLKFKKEGVEALADIAFHVNQTSQNIGARRLYTLLERLLEDVSFAAPDAAKKTITIDGDYVKDKLEAITANEDLTKFIL
ncbi:MAG TPA: ATP-dependent protease ATPase subunit HslU [Planctomycetaceae bacterium]|jgi:ATP-dependent HslUV protease ATP-binding subunit HslU|nr:ATP-dependent protease ATPase subunit HslU [Planctomycetaceae bacterium]